MLISHIFVVQSICNWFYCLTVWEGKQIAWITRSCKKINELLRVREGKCMSTVQCTTFEFRLCPHSVHICAEG